MIITIVTIIISIVIIIIVIIIVIKVWPSALQSQPHPAGARRSPTLPLKTLLGLLVA